MNSILCENYKFFKIVLQFDDKNMKKNFMIATRTDFANEKFYWEVVVLCVIGVFFSLHIDNSTK